jgi:hypothetical protein
MITPEGITVWAGLAFVLWLAITLALHHVIRRQRAMGIAIAAVLSWLIAGAALSMMAPLVHWLDSYL